MRGVTRNASHGLLRRLHSLKTIATMRVQTVAANPWPHRRNPSQPKHPDFSKFLRRSIEFGSMEYPNLIFSQLGRQLSNDIVIQNAMMRGYDINGPFEQCVSVFDEMPLRGIKPHNFTDPCVLNSCTTLGWYGKGKQVHCHIVKHGFESNLAVANAVFNMYVKMPDSCDSGVVNYRTLNDARKVFDDMCVRPSQCVNLASETSGGCDHSKLLSMKS